MAEVCWLSAAYSLDTPTPGTVWLDNIKLLIRKYNRYSNKKIKEWNVNMDNKNISVTSTTVDGKDVKVVSIDGHMSLQSALKMLQGYPNLFPKQTDVDTTFKMNIGGRVRVFKMKHTYLKSATFGIVDDQLFVWTDDKDWPDTLPNKQGSNTQNPQLTTLIYTLKGDNTTVDHTTAILLLKALAKPLNEQPHFEDSVTAPQKVRAMVDFLLLTQVTMAARVTSPDMLTTWQNAVNVAEMSNNTNNLWTILKPLKQSSRLIGFDEFISDKLKAEIVDGGYDFGIFLHKTVDKEADQYAGKLDVIEEIITQDSNKEHKDTMYVSKTKSDCALDLWMLSHKSRHEQQAVLHVQRDHVRMEAMQEGQTQYLIDMINKIMHVGVKNEGQPVKGRRTKRSINPPRVEDLQLKPGSVFVEEELVRFTVIDRKNPTVEYPMSVRLETIRLVRETYVEDLVLTPRHGMDKFDTKGYVSNFMGTYGIIQGYADADNILQDGDAMRGATFASQFISNFVDLDANKKAIANIAKDYLKNVISQKARVLGLDNILAKFMGGDKTADAKDMTTGTKKAIGGFNMKGFVFDLEKIGSDITDIINTDMYDTYSLLVLPLKVIHLVLDVCSTVLKLAAISQPELEPLIQVISIVRMTIDDFYVEIVDELSMVNWKGPWAPLEAIGAIIVGIIEGGIDLVTGGLIRQLKQLGQEHKANQKLLGELANEQNYYNIDLGGDGSKRFNFLNGTMSIFGGDITFELLDNGHIKLRIDNVPKLGGGVHTISQIISDIPKDVNDIILGLGQSREFTYQTKKAKLLWLITIKSYKIICSERLINSSLHGTYYGNCKDNRFFAVQHTPKLGKESEIGKECTSKYGHFDVDFAVNHYSYNLYGRGGDDVFFLGRQSSHVEGGEGSDLMLLQDNGGVAIVNNFARDGNRDMMYLNSSFNTMHCMRKHQDLHIMYMKTHHVVVQNWFIGGNPKHYRHMVFKSREGYMFSPVDLGYSDTDQYEIECRVKIVEKSEARIGQHVDLTKDPLKHVIQVVGSSCNQGVTNCDDVIIGNSLDNFLDGAGGSDILTGGNGSDIYIVSTQNGSGPIHLKIHNFAPDNKTDNVLFDIPFSQIKPLERNSGLDLVLCDNKTIGTTNISCVYMVDWFKGSSHQHASFVSSDHAIFSLVQDGNTLTAVPFLLDYSGEKEGVTVHLDEYDQAQTTDLPVWAYSQIITVLDSPHEDIISGNSRQNFISCSGSGTGIDILAGMEGEDSYVIKENCTRVKIINHDIHHEWDVLYMRENYQNIHLYPMETHLVIEGNKTTVEVDSWFAGPEHRHLLVQTLDGIVIMLPESLAELEQSQEHDQYKPVAAEITKDPQACICPPKTTCKNKMYNVNLIEERFEKVTRVKLASSFCDYNITGNVLDNYIDPGIGMKQFLQGNNGKDTYVINRDYGTVYINNYAADNATDYVRLGLSFTDASVNVDDNYNVILTSKQGNASINLIFQNYFMSTSYQHLYIQTVDGVTFYVTNKYPYTYIVAMDLSAADSSRKILLDKFNIYHTTLNVFGSLSHQNVIKGNAISNMLVGGKAKDKIHGTHGHDWIEGLGGNDRLLGGLGMDAILGGKGQDIIDGGPDHDVIFPGDDGDLILGGHGHDTVVLKGDCINAMGVFVDLKHAVGSGGDATDDVYLGVENVLGSEFADVLIGDEYNNELSGHGGDDVLVPGHADDVLSGGKGADIYHLLGTTGFKVINNFDVNETVDIVLLNDTSWSQVNYFRRGDHLHLAINKGQKETQYSSNTNLDLLIVEWFNSSKYRHLYMKFSGDVGISEVEFEHAVDVSYCISSMKNVSAANVTESGTSYVHLAWQPSVAAIVQACDCQLFVGYTTDITKYTLHLLPADSASALKVRNLTPSTTYSFSLVLAKNKRILAMSGDTTQATSSAVTTWSIVLIIVFIGVIVITVIVVKVHWTRRRRRFLHMNAPAHISVRAPEGIHTDVHTSADVHCRRAADKPDHDKIPLINKKSHKRIDAVVNKLTTF